MATGKPAVSVVIAAYNGAGLIGATLASLSRQRFSDFEVVVVDDGSADATRGVVLGWPDPRVRLVALPANGGVVQARNRGVAEARGRYIAALDQDDLCHPDRLGRQVAFLEDNPAVALVGSAANVLTERGMVIPMRAGLRRTTPLLLGWLLRIGNPLVWSSVMMRGEAARALTPFNRPDRLFAEDLDLYHRIGAYGAVARIDDPLVTYRRHAGGASQRYEERMLAAAGLTLAEAARPVFGDRAAEVAGLFVRHLMHGEPAPDAATLARLGMALVAARLAYLDIAQPDALDRRLIDRITAVRWRHAVRAAVRSGAIGGRAALDAARVGPVPARLDQLAWGGIVGSARRLARREPIARPA